MKPRPTFRATLLIATLALGACGQDTSLREALQALPQDSARPAPTPAVDTAGSESASVPVTFPESVDTTPPDSAPPVAAERPPPAPALGEWTAGVVGAERPGVGMTTLTAVRIARHPGFDRVVFEFSGGGLPGYQVEYVDRPVRECASGRAVEIAGAGWLRVRLRPAQAHDARGRSSLPARAIRPAAANLLEARTVCDFEGVVEWVLGVRSPTRYRLLELPNPSRLVVDLQF